MTPEKMIDVVTNRRVGYYMSSIPDSYDRELSDFIASFCTLSEQDKKLILDCLDGKARATLQTFAERMTSLALNDNSEQPIFDGIVAAGISLERENRETYLYYRALLTLLYHSCSRLKLDFRSIVARAAPYIGSEATANMENFADDPNT